MDSEHIPNYQDIETWAMDEPDGLRGATREQPVVGSTAWDRKRLPSYVMGSVNAIWNSEGDEGLLARWMAGAGVILAALVAAWATYLDRIPTVGFSWSWAWHTMKHGALAPLSLLPVVGLFTTILSACLSVWHWDEFEYPDRALFPYARIVTVLFHRPRFERWLSDTRYRNHSELGQVLCLAGVAVHFALILAMWFSFVLPPILILGTFGKIFVQRGPMWWVPDFGTTAAHWRSFVEDYAPAVVLPALLVALVVATTIVYRKLPTWFRPIRFLFRATGWMGHTFGAIAALGTLVLIGAAYIAIAWHPAIAIAHAFDGIAAAMVYALAAVAAGAGWCMDVLGAVAIPLIAGFVVCAVSYIAYAAALILIPPLAFVVLGTIVELIARLWHLYGRALAEALLEMFFGNLHGGLDEYFNASWVDRLHHGAWCRECRRRADDAARKGPQEL